MYIFIDEAGDLGLDYETKKPSRYFIVTALVCNNRKTAKYFDYAVKKTLRNKLKCKHNNAITSELKGNATTNSIKSYFYSKIQTTEDWKIYTIALDKINFINRQEQQPDKDRLYNKLICSLLNTIELSNANIVNVIIDKSKSRIHAANLNTELYSQMNHLLPLSTSFNITHELSHNNKGIQAVDMFCYGIFRKYEHNDTLWYDLFLPRVYLEKEIMHL